MKDDDLDRLLRRSTPSIDEGRIGRVERAILLEQAHQDAWTTRWFGWLNARQGVAFAGFFLLGVVVNLMMRASGPTPLDLLLAPSSLLPWGG